MNIGSFKIDPLNLPYKEKFEEMKKEIIRSSIIRPQEITEIGYLYRKDFTKANEIYEIALSKVDGENEKEVNDIKINMLGLKVQYGVAKESDFYELNMINDKRLELLKGFYFYNKGENEKAYISFSKIEYQRGMCLTSGEMKKTGIYREIKEPIMRCYNDSKVWKEYKGWKEYKENNDYKENNGWKENNDCNDYKENNDCKDNDCKDNDCKDNNDYNDYKENNDCKDNDNNDCKDNDCKDNNDYNDYKENNDCYDYDCKDYDNDCKDYDNDCKDFLYRIGHSKTYENKNNVDVILRRIEEEIKEGCNEERLEEHISSLMNLKKTYNKSTEILYLLGKINHIQKKYENAKEYYNEVLEYDREYMPAELNLSRINGEIRIKNSKYISVNDAMVLISIINKNYEVNINGCSDCVRKIYQIMVKDKNNDITIINDYEKLIQGKYFENIEDGSKERIINGWIKKEINEDIKIDEILFDREAIYNNWGILEKDKVKGCKLLEDAFGSEEYEDYLKYNLGILNNDIELLKSLNMKEAKLQVSLLLKDININYCSNLQAYNLYEKNKEESEILFKKISEEKKDINKLYADIWLGCINIDKYLNTNNIIYLENANLFFMNNVKSFYCVNGLGIIEYLYGRYNFALNYFEQISGEYQKVLYNISCCYINMENYSKAAKLMIEYLNFYNSDTNAKKLLDFCNFKIKENTQTQTNNNKISSELNNKISSELNIGIKEKEDVERKRKIKDILEARKKLNIN